MPGVVGALSSLEPAPMSSQTTPGSGAQAPLLPVRSQWQGGHPPWLHSMTVTPKAMPQPLGMVWPNGYRLEKKVKYCIAKMTKLLGFLHRRRKSSVAFKKAPEFNLQCTH